MRYLVVGVLVAGLGAGGARRAAAETCPCDSPETNAAGRVPALPRGSFVTSALAINSAFTGIQAASYAFRGKRFLAASGIQLLATTPIAIYGWDLVNWQPRDPAVWALSIWATALALHGLSPFFVEQFTDHPVAGGDSLWFDTGEEPGLAIRVEPSLIVGWDDHQPRAGLVALGTF